MNWSSNWKSSRKAKKQRKYRYNAPLHIRKRLLNAHLSKELRQKYNRRSLALVKEDKVKVMRGKFKGHKGKIDQVMLKKSKVIVQGIEIEKKDGTKTMPLIDPSNLLLIELKLDDKKRLDLLQRTKKGVAK